MRAEDLDNHAQAEGINHIPVRSLQPGKNNHAQAEGINLSGSEDWNGGKDAPYFWMQSIEDYLSEQVDDMDLEIARAEESETEFLDFDFRLPDLDLLSGEDEDVDLASEQEIMQFADEIYDCFENVFDLELDKEIRDEWKERTVYDEGLRFKASKTVENSDFWRPAFLSYIGAFSGVIANSYRAWEKYDIVLEDTGSFTQAQKAKSEALALNDEIAIGVMGLGIAYGLKKSYSSMNSQFTGKFLHSKPSWFKSLDVGSKDPAIAITPNKRGKKSAFYASVAENLHMLQDHVGSPTSHDPLLNEGMDVFTKYLVAKEMEPYEFDIGHEREASEIAYEALLEAYGIMKNNGGYTVDDDTFIDVGLDPEASERMSSHVKDHMSRTDRTDEQLFGYSVGAAYLIMEYEKGNIDPGEVLRNGREEMPWQFKQIYDTPMMDNI
ncbi:hypothetical protein GLT92_00390 [Nanohaloarchaea archaeon]|nr:hypothetical protein [Candidatus Nanohaloarchaea archaeon]